MKKRLILFVMMVCTAVSFAGDLTTTSGKVYKNYAIMGAAPNGIRVFHEGGSVVLPVSEFPPELKSLAEKIAKDIPAAKKAAAERVKEREALAAERKKLALEEAAKQKKSAALLADEEKAEKEKQDKLKKATPAPSSSSFTTSSGSSGSSSGKSSFSKK